ncbi:MAG: hypothetical protein U0797_21055 [Gemmataceae bacterium]
MKAGGGLITLDDLAGYRAKQREPIRGSYRGYDVSPRRRRPPAASASSRCSTSWRPSTSTGTPGTPPRRCT